MVNIQPVTVWGLLRATFLNKWVALVTALFTGVGVLDFVDTHVAPKFESFKAKWDRYYVLPHWRWQTWVMTALVAVFVAGLRGAYVFARRYYEASVRLDEEYCQPRVSIEYCEDQPRFIGLKTINRRDYRVLRVKVTNIGGERLYGLKAQVRLSNKHYTYSGDDLTLMEESLPIIQRILYRHESNVLPRPRTSFSLLRGDHQFVNVAMQVSEDGKWKDVELCLSAIAADNYSNIVNVQQPIRFSLLILGELQPPSSESFVLFLDENKVLRMKKEGEEAAYAASSQNVGSMPSS